MLVSWIIISAKEGYKISPLAKNRTWLVSFKKRCSASHNSVIRKHCIPGYGLNGFRVHYEATWFTHLHLGGGGHNKQRFSTRYPKYTEAFVIPSPHVIGK